MRFFVVGTAVLAAAAWAAGCSDDASVAPATPNDAGPDTATPADTGSPVDAGGETSTGIDCAKDDDVDGIKKHLACTGLYADFAAKAVAPDVKEFTPALQFWSDGAVKTRWVKLPPGAKIDATDLDEWVYPEGIQLWKEFKVDGKRAETRLYEKRTLGWRHTVYRWNADETDAIRKEVGELIPPNGARTKTYEIPNTTQCGACHDGRKEPVLGFDAIGLGLPGAQGVTLATLVAGARFTGTLPATTLSLPDNDAGARDAFGWMHANCGACHNGNSGAAALFTTPRLLARPSDLLGLDGGTPATATTITLYTSTVCVDSKRDDPDGRLIKLVRAGDPTASLVSTLSGARVPEGMMPSSTQQMPPLVTRAADTAGRAKLDTWITALTPACP